MKIVALTGAGISAPSGVRTFRDANGLWENHRVEDVATPEGWRRDPGLVLRFYNERRAQLATVRPNAAHLALAAWERAHEVVVITQNVDDLHERAGSTRVIHLHGELVKARGTRDDSCVMRIDYAPIALGAAKLRLSAAIPRTLRSTPLWMRTTPKPARTRSPRRSRWWTGLR